MMMVVGSDSFGRKRKMTCAHGPMEFRATTLIPGLASMASYRRRREYKRAQEREKPPRWRLPTPGGKKKRLPTVTFDTQL